MKCKKRGGEVCNSLFFNGGSKNSRIFERENNEGQSISNITFYGAVKGKVFKL